MKFLFLSFFLLVTTHLSAQKKDTLSFSKQSIGYLADEYLAINPQASGVIVAIDYPGKLSWRYATGHRSMEKIKPLNGDEPFIAASITKIFISVIILQMQEEAKLSIEDKVIQYLDPDLIRQLTTFGGNSHEEVLTIEHLLRHTSGISDYLNKTQTHLNGYRNAPDKVYSFKDRMQIALKVPSSQKFGKYHYSNTNYLLLGMIVEKIDQMNASAILDKRIFTPLKLENSSLMPSKTILPQMLKGYYTDWDLTSFSFHFNKGNTAGGLLTTTADLLKFGKSVFTGALFKSKATLARMLEFEKGYGLGVMQFEKSKKAGRVIGHSGFDPGYTCYLAYLEKLNTTVLTLINQSELEVIMPAFLLVKIIHLIKKEP